MKKPISAQPLILNAAISYAKKGWKVLPVFSTRNGHCTCAKGAACTRPGKHPATKHGVHAASSNLETIHRWFGPTTQFNVAVATGKASGLLVVDVDPRNGGDATFDALKEKAALPRTARSKTGGAGRHYFFKYPTNPSVLKKATLGAGVDLQGDGKYVVMPPSLHASGERYRWFKDRGVAQAPANIPKQWLEPTPTTVDALPPTAGARIVEGERNIKLASIAGTLVNSGMSAEQILATLQTINASFAPPLDDAEVRAVAASISRREVHPHTGDDAEAFVNSLLERHFEGGKHILLGPDQRLWHFHETQWSPMTDDHLAHIALKLTNEVGLKVHMAKTALLGQVRQIIRAKSFIAGDPLRFCGDPPSVINVRNGELWLGENGSVTLKPHSYASYLRYTLDVVYDPAAQCPTYDSTVAEIFDKSPDPQGLADFWHEVCGYALQPSRRCAMIVIGRGGGSNGKTQLAATLTRMLGADAVVATQIEAVEKERFLRGHLLGKLLMIDDDVKAGVRLPDGALKKISEEKLMTGEHKNGSHFQFTSRVLPLLLCNNPPSIADLSKGLERRIHVVPFDRTFDKPDAQRFDRIWRSEMSGILNRYLEGLGRVVARGWAFERPTSVRTATDEFLTGANPLPEFVAEMCDTGTKKSDRLEFLYQHYCNWSSNNGITLRQQKSAFKRNLAHLGYTMIKRNDGVHVVGLSLKSLSP